MSDERQTQVQTIANEASLFENNNGEESNPAIKLYHYEVEIKMHNPFVIIVGIPEYKDDKWKDLPAAAKDINMMKKLWRTTLGYDTRILTECEVINDERYNPLCTQEHIQSFLEYECLRVLKDQKKSEKDKWYDGLICIVSAHGLRDSIVTSDGKLVNIKEDLFVPFNPRKVKNLSQFPKIYIFDACRGELHPDIVIEMEQVKGITDYKFMAQSNVESDYRISYATTEGKNAPIRDDGGVFIRPLYEIMMHLHKKDILAAYSFQRILKMSSRMAKKQNKNNVCPVHEDYTHYKIFFDCANVIHEHKMNERKMKDDMEDGKRELRHLRTVSLLDLQHTESELLKELYAPKTCCEKVKRCLRSRRNRGVRGLEEDRQDDCFCCIFM